MPLAHLIVPPDLAGQRLDLVLDRLVPDRTRSQLQKLVRRGHVRIGGKRVLRSNVRVAARAEITVEVEAEAQRATELVVLHEDAEILVIDKPTGLLTHPADRSTAPSLAEILDAHHGPLPTVLGEERPGIVHRLDRETSGVLVVGRTEQAMRQLSEQFRARLVEKTYLALVSNVPEPGPFVIEERVAPVPGKADRQGIDPVRGKESRTEVQRREAFERHALVACAPRTGRRHQLRVHLAARGFPVLSDPLYGTRSQKPLPSGVPAPPRLALHAHRLTFTHPSTGERVTFEAELSADLLATLTALRSAGRRDAAS